MWAFAGVGVAFCRSLGSGHASVFACFAYIHMPCIRAHVKCSSWEGLRVAEREFGEHWVGWHGTFEPSSFGVSVSGMLCLVDAEGKVFWASSIASIGRPSPSPSRAG